MNYGILTYDYSVNGSSVKLNSVTIVSYPDGNTRIYRGDLITIIEKLLTFGIDTYFVMDGAHFFGFIDYYATQQKLPLYDDLKAQGVARINCPAWAIREGLGESYSRKLWIRANSKNSRHKRMYSAAFMNFSAIMGTRDLTDACKMFNITCDRHYKQPEFKEENAFLDLLDNFNKLFFEITGEYYLRPNGVACWTMGGAAKNFYLKLKYPDCKGRLRSYQYTHPQNINYEYALREYGLLPPGLLYQADNYIHTDIKKWDINSLYLATERELPELGKLHKCDISEYEFLDRTDDNYEYILIIKSGMFRKKTGMPAIWHNPFETYSGFIDNKEYITINQPWAVFLPYFQALLKFYNIYDIEIQDVLKARKNPDAAILAFSDKLYPRKAQAREEGNEGLATLVKFFINNLHGKFAQKTIDLKNDYYFDEELKQVCKVPKNYIDEWDEKHFDYIRGAYIYSMAATRVLNDIADFGEYIKSQGDKRPLKDYIIYVDTDCIITPLILPAKMISQTELGKYKLENNFRSFQAIAPKTYFGELPYDLLNPIPHRYKFVCAGINKYSLEKQIEDYFENNIYECSMREISALLLSNHLFTVKVLKRGCGGNYYDTVYRKISSQDFHDREL